MSDLHMSWVFQVFLVRQVKVLPRTLPAADTTHRSLVPSGDAPLFVSTNLQVYHSSLARCLSTVPSGQGIRITPAFNEIVHECTSSAITAI